MTSNTTKEDKEYRNMLINNINRKKSEVKNMVGELESKLSDIDKSHDLESDDIESLTNCLYSLKSLTDGLNMRKF